MADTDKAKRFEKTVWPHLAAAYNLARWLTRRDSDAEDVVQEATLRAFRFFNDYRGGDSRAWFLAIVRNAGYSWLRQNRSHEAASDIDDESNAWEDNSPGPEARALENADREFLRHALEELPPEFREVLVLRELEGLSYKEICEVAGLPMGTVMSRLARARDRLLHALTRRQSKETKREL
jgi:RNA polymerase sigma-70 factor (ECF subfamily)